MIKRVRVKVVNHSVLPLPEYSTEQADAVDLRAALDCLEFKGDDPDPIIIGNGLYSLTKLYAKPGVCLARGEEIEIHVFPGGRLLVPTGLKVELPKGYRIHVYARSGISLKNGITIANGVGKIDSDYRGYIGAVLFNTGQKDFIIKHGDRIAQMSIEESIHMEWDRVDKLEDTQRGEGGFGHTGQ